MKERLFQLADWWLPAHDLEPAALHRHRAAILQSWVGLVLTVPFSWLYVALGSPWSGAAITLITVGLLASPWLIRRGVPLQNVTHVLIGATWTASIIVATRSGGLESPAVLWSFILPISTYSVCGARAAVAWAILAAAEVSGLYLAELAGVEFFREFVSPQVEVLVFSGYIGILIGVVAVLYVVENSRIAAAKAMDQANRVLERERLVHDMHDGIGSQLVGLLALARLGRLEPGQLIAGLEASLDDMRLIIDCRETQDPPLALALGELRLRTAQRCSAAGIELQWDVAVEATRWTPDVTLQVLRSAAEMLNNALQHALPRRLHLELVSRLDAPWVSLTVADDGVGIAHRASEHRGRGLKSLDARARRLGGKFEVFHLSPGTRVTLSFPFVSSNSP